MKRSEALKVIGKLLMFGLEGMPKEKIESYKNTAFADIILTELELLGMVPPKHYSQQDGNVYSYWEPEASFDTEQDDLCSYCNGTGESIPSPDMLCTTCKGSGVKNY